MAARSMTLAAFLLVGGRAQVAKAESSPWTAAMSANPVPHFEEIHGHQVLFVNGEPFTVLGVEIP